MNQLELSNLKENWEKFVFDLIEYPSSHFQSILQSFNRDFIQGLPLLDENFIQGILFDNK